MEKVLVVAPVHDRAWILSDYFHCIENQNWPLENLGFLFECAPADQENGTIQCLVDFAARHPEFFAFDIQINTQVEHHSHPEGGRLWSPSRYEVMAQLRNNLLERATCLSPDRVFSLDTDILLEDPNTISILVGVTNSASAASPLIFMTPDTIDFPGVMSWISQGGGPAYRAQYPLGSVFRADVIMAAKMMTPNVFRQVRYCPHRQGEDLGWSAHAARLGCDLYCASQIYANHVMSRTELDIYRKSGDRRKALLLETHPKYLNR